MAQKVMSKANEEVFCEGWWHQSAFGRQPMCNLRLRFSGGKIFGSGHDIVGVFTFRGTITAQGKVHLVKRYLGSHTVDYVGTFDGEGLLFGEWYIGPVKDKWMIRLKPSKAAGLQDSAIEEIV